MLRDKWEFCRKIGKEKRSKVLAKERLGKEEVREELLYADDLVLMAESEEEAVEKFSAWRRRGKEGRGRECERRGRDDRDGSVKR